MRCAILGLAATLLLATPVLAQKQSPDPAALPNAQSLIDDCTARFRQQYDSGITAEMRAASVNNSACLDEAIIAHSKVLFADQDAAAERFQKYLRQLRQGNMRIHWELYNETRYCGKTQNCGSYRQLKHASHHTYTLEEMLRDILAYRREEGF